MSCGSEISFIIPEPAMVVSDGAGWQELSFSNVQRYGSGLTPSTTYTLGAFNLGSGYAAYDLPDAIYIENLRRFCDMTFNTVEVKIEAANNSGFSSGLLTDTYTVASADCLGWYQSDFIDLLSNINAKRQYWRATLTFDEPVNSINWGAVVLGKRITLDRNPVMPFTMAIQDQYENAERNSVVLDLRFDGISFANKAAFDLALLKYADFTPVILYDPQELILFNAQVARFVILRHGFKMSRGGCDYSLDISLEEALGG